MHAGRESCARRSRFPHQRPHLRRRDGLMKDDLRTKLRRDRLSSVFSTRWQGLLDHRLNFGHMTDTVAELVYQR
jgi:hypothetical protein